MKNKLDNSMCKITISHYIAEMCSKFKQTIFLFSLCIFDKTPILESKISSYKLVKNYEICLYFVHILYNSNK